MALRYKVLYSVDPHELLKGSLQVQLKVIGIFDTSKVIWRYFAFVDGMRNHILTFIC